jgi:hypothetical protein
MTTEQLEHYRKVKKARRERELPVYTDQAKWDRRADENNMIGVTNRFGREQVEGSEHPLLGMRLQDTETGNTYVVDSVSNCWLDGFYIQMAIREENTKSHGLIFWENINSESETVVSSVQETHERYEVLEKSNV